MYDIKRKISNLVLIAVLAVVPYDMGTLSAGENIRTDEVAYRVEPVARWGVSFGYGPRRQYREYRNYPRYYYRHRHPYYRSRYPYYRYRYNRPYYNYYDPYYYYYGDGARIYFRF